MSPRGRAERSMEAATGPSSSVGTAARAAAHARVRESDSTATSGQLIGELGHDVSVPYVTDAYLRSVARVQCYAQTGDEAVENLHGITVL